MTALSISAVDQTIADSAATEIEQIMIDGANVGLAQVIPPVTNYSSSSIVQSFFKATAVGILRRITNAKIIYANASTTAGQAVAANNAYTTVNFNTVQKDTGPTITIGSNWVFKCPVGAAGLYHLNTLVTLTSPVSGDNAEISLWRVGADVLGTESLEVVLGATRTPPVGGSLGSFLSSGSYIELAENEGLRIKVRTTAVSAQALKTDAGTNWVRIHRVSNTPT